MLTQKTPQLFLVTCTLLFAMCNLVSANDETSQGNRILTIQQWSSESEAIVWAVQKHKIIIYKTYDSGHPDKLLASRPLTNEESVHIQNAIHTIPKDAFGYLYLDKYYGHSPSLRLLFTADGSPSSERIEISTLIPRWSRDISNAISKLLPEEFHISYENISKAHYSRMKIDSRDIVVLRKLIKDIDCGADPKGVPVEGGWYDRYEPGRELKTSGAN